MPLPFSVTVRWNRFFYISLSYFLLGLICMPFSKTFSVIFFLLLITFWTAIPGLINIHLIEIDIYEMVFTIMAINFGGLLAGLLAIPYIALHCLVSVQFQPKEAIRYSIAAIITLSSMPFVHRFLGGNLLYTLYAFTIISYTIFLLVTIFIMTAEIFNTIRYMMLALPIAFLTNTMYVKVFGDPMLTLFNKSMELRMTLPIVLGVFLLAILGFKIFSKYSTKWGGAEQKPKPAESKPNSYGDYGYKT